MREGAGLTAPPPHKTQRAVGELCRFQRSAHPLALHHHAEAPAGVVAVKHAAGEGPVENAHQQQLVANFDNGLKRGGGSRRRWPAPGSGNPPAARGSPSRMKRKTHDKSASYAGTHASATLRGRGAVRRAARTLTRSHTAYRCGSLFVMYVVQEYGLILTLHQL